MKWSAEGNQADLCMDSMTGFRGSSDLPAQSSPEQSSPEKSGLFSFLLSSLERRHFSHAHPDPADRDMDFAVIMSGSNAVISGDSRALWQGIQRNMNLLNLGTSCGIQFPSFQIITFGKKPKTEDEIFRLMTEFLEKQETLNEIDHPENLTGYSTTGLHVLKTICESENASVTFLEKSCT